MHSLNSSILFLRDKMDIHIPIPERCVIGCCRQRGTADTLVILFVSYQDLRLFFALHLDPRALNVLRVRCCRVSVPWAGLKGAMASGRKGKRMERQKNRLCCTHLCFEYESALA